MKFDPDNPSMEALLANISELLKAQPPRPAVPPTSAVAPTAAPLAAAEAVYKADPSNLTNAFQLASMYFSLQRSNEGYQVLDSLLANSNANSQTVLSVANAYSQLQNAAGLERAFGRATQIMPDSAETWYDYSRVQATIGKLPGSLSSLKRAVELSNARLKTNPAAFNVSKDAITNPSFAPLRANQDFLRTVAQ
jgi:tetratricopeptide (TPR) repeat protein